MNLLIFSLVKLHSWLF